MPFWCHDFLPNFRFFDLVLERWFYYSLIVSPYELSMHRIVDLNVLYQILFKIKKDLELAKSYKHILVFGFGQFPGWS